MEKVEIGGLSASTLKLIAIAAMLIDHIAWAYVPTLSVQGQLLHVIGRLTAPIMCYFIAEGYYYTKNMKRYIGRLALFALISHFAFAYYESGRLPIEVLQGHLYVSDRLSTSVIYTLLMGLLTLVVWNYEGFGKSLKAALILLLCFLSDIGDWGAIAVLWVFFFGLYRGNFKKQMISFSLVGILAWLLPIINYSSPGAPWWAGICQMGVYLVIPLLSLYNGRLGSRRMKWLFYMFYPLHLFILGFFIWG